MTIIHKEGDIINNYTLLQGRILQKMKIKGLKQADLAKLTGYKLSTIQAFMSETGNKSERAAECICKALEIER